MWQGLWWRFLNRRKNFCQYNYEKNIFRFVFFWTKDFFMEKGDTVSCVVLSPSLLFWSYRTEAPLACLFMMENNSVILNINFSAPSIDSADRSWKFWPNDQVQGWQDRKLKRGLQNNCYVVITTVTFRPCKIFMNSAYLLLWMLQKKAYWSPPQE